MDRDAGLDDAAALGGDFVARLKAGDEAAFDHVVRRYGGMLLVGARRILGNEHDAQEAVQDAFLSAFRGLKKYDGTSQLSTWLYRVGINAALMKLRARKRKSERLIEDLLPRFKADGHQAEPAAPWSDNAAVAGEVEETRALVREAIAELPELYRTVLLMRDLQEMDTATTAVTLGVSEGVVKTRLHRARLALRTLLDEHFREEAAC